MTLQQAKSKAEQCYDAKNWFCIAMLILQFGKTIYDYIRLLKKERKNEATTDPSNK